MSVLTEAEVAAPTAELEELSRLFLDQETIALLDADLAMLTEAFTSPDTHCC